MAKRDEWSAEMVRDTLEKRIDRLHEEIIRELAGFPEQYARNAEVAALRDLLESVRIDHVHRRELEQLQKLQGDDMQTLQTKFDESTGRRAPVTAAIAIIAVLLSVLFGYILNTQMTSAQVSDQIQREAPWNRDRPVVAGQINQLEGRLLAQTLQINRLQSRVDQLCKRHVPQC